MIILHAGQIITGREWEFVVCVFFFMWSDSLKGKHHQSSSLTQQWWISPSQSSNGAKRNEIVVDLSASDPCCDCYLLLLSTTRRISTDPLTPLPDWSPHGLSDENSPWLIRPDKQLQEPRYTYQINQIIVNYAVHTWSRLPSII